MSVFCFGVSDGSSLSIYFSNNIGFQIDKIPFVPLVQVRLTDGVRYRGHGKARRFHRSHGQADTVYCDRAFFNDIAKDRRICMNGVPDSRIVFSDISNASDAIHMACYDVSAKTSVGRHGTFQIDSTSNGELCKCRAVQGLVHDIRSKAIREELPDGQTDAVDGDAVTNSGFFQNRFCTNSQYGRMLSPIDGFYCSDFFHDSGKHGYSTSLSIRKSLPSCSNRLFFRRNAASGSGTPAPSMGALASLPPNSFGAM